MQPIPLGGLKRGIDRTRIRGKNADGALYDLQNAYLTIAGSIKKRPPFKKVATLDAATKGLFANGGKLHTFFTGAILNSPLPDLIEYHALQPPLVPAGQTQPVNLTGVYFDALYLGTQYVIAQFDDGNYRHYWLTEPATWKANTVYGVGNSVQPSVPNGYYYVLQAGPNNNVPAWQANEVHAIGDKIQPSVPNGYYFTATNTVGTNPKSGVAEPTWPAVTGGVVYEDGNITLIPPPPPLVPPQPITGGTRYTNPGGSLGGGGANGGWLSGPGQTIKRV